MSLTQEFNVSIYCELGTVVEQISVFSLFVSSSKLRPRSKPFLGDGLNWNVRVDKMTVPSLKLDQLGYNLKKGT